MAIVRHVKHVIATTASKLLLNKARMSATTMGKGWTTMKLVPDVFDEVPPSKVNVIYPEVNINEGNVVRPVKTKDAPKVAWKLSKTQPDALYTLCFADPDAPSHSKPILREWAHWLVVNIPGRKVEEGEVIMAYVACGPPKDTGLHRYFFAVFRQPGKITCDEKKADDKTSEPRQKFSIRKFSEKYKLGPPVAGNFFQAQFDDYVLKVHEQLGIKH